MSPRVFALRWAAAPAVPRSLRPFRSRGLRAIFAALCGAVTVSGWGSIGAAPASTATATADVAPARTASVTVSPFPGTPDASPSTQISFLGGPATTVTDVRVVGSSSGAHAGRLAAYSAGTGESFIPDRPFLSGERVNVSARVVERASTATVRTSFTVAFDAPVSQPQFPNYPGSAADVQHYLSAPSITPSTVTVTTPAHAAATTGDFFLAPYQGAGTPGPMIVDQSGNLIWFHALAAGQAATNFRVQRYEGRSVLTWWQGRILGLGFGQGEDEIYDRSYQLIARVIAGNGYHADLHQFLLAGHGTAWIDAFDPVEIDLTGAGGARRGVLTDSVVQEIDVRTGLVMWEWHALGHIPLRDSYAPAPRGSHPWDYAHVNSADPAVPGRVLLSARNTWTIYDVNSHTGAVVWRIGGKHSSFKLHARAIFHYQHDAAWQPGGLVSVFDNGGTEEQQSRGLLLGPNTTTHTVTLLKQFTNPNIRLLTASQGDLVSLAGGNWLMGYGGLPNFTEYDSAGEVLFDGTLGPGVEDYRTYLAPWSGQPKTVPAIAAQAGADGRVTVQASWNGATAVSAWEVLAGLSTGPLSVLATVPRQGFETSIAVSSSEPDVAVAALGSSGQVLASSRAISPGG